MAALQRFYSLECGGISVLRDGRWEDGRNGWVAGLGGFVGGGRYMDGGRRREVLGGGTERCCDEERGDGMRRREMG